MEDSTTAQFMAINTSLGSVTNAVEKPFIYVAQLTFANITMTVLVSLVTTVAVLTALSVSNIRPLVATLRKICSLLDVACVE